jgi:hypothetical protein
MNRLLNGRVGAAERLRGRFSWLSIDGALRQSISSLLPKLIVDIARQASSEFSYEPLGWAASRRTLGRKLKLGDTIMPPEKKWPLIVENVKGGRTARRVSLAFPKRTRTFRRPQHHDVLRVCAGASRPKQTELEDLGLGKRTGTLLLVQQGALTRPCARLSLL